MNETERKFAELKSIDEPVDWSANDNYAAMIETIQARDMMAAYLRNAQNAGYVMRGVTIAIADYFQTKDLERGMASTMRGVRNAFASTKRARQGSW